MNHKIYIIVAVDQNMGIGKDGKLPWHLPSELKHFQEMTTKTEDPKKQNRVIMGRSTWESIPTSFRPLKNRQNVVLTKNPDYQAEGARIYHSLDEAIDSADSSIENIFVIGGGRVYAETILHPGLDRIYLTRIEGNFECDTFFPDIPAEFGEPASMGKNEEEGISYDYLFYERKT